MGLKLGSTDIDDIKLGSAQVDAVYLGSDLVWEPAGPTGPTDPPDIAFELEFWTGDPTYTPPADGGTVTVAPNNLGTAGGTWTIGGTPTWRASAFNGKPAVEFQGAGKRLSKGRSADAAIRTFVAVARCMGTSDSDIWDTDTSGRSLFDASGGSWRFYSGSVGTIQTANTSLHLFIGEYSTASGTHKFWLDGTLVSSTINAGTQPAGVNTYIAHMPNGAANADGTQIAYLGFIPRVLTAQERADLLAWAQSNYGTP